jgi:predicted Zn-dependent protease
MEYSVGSDFNPSVEPNQQTDILVSSSLPENQVGIIRKLALVLVLILILVTLFSCLFIFFAKFNENSFFGKIARKELIKHPSLSHTINLNQPGDEKYAYLDHNNDIIRVQLVFIGNAEPDINLENWVDKMISETTGKKAEIHKVDSLLFDEQVTYSNKDLLKIRDGIKNNSDMPELNIVYLSSYSDIPTYGGLVQNKNTIYIFKGTLNNLTPDKKQVSTLEKSTLLHEWGHLLGLEHNDISGCVMSNKVEVSDMPYLYGSQIPTDYCQNELEELKTISE